MKSSNGGVWKEQLHKVDGKVYPSDCVGETNRVRSL